MLYVRMQVLIPITDTTYLCAAFELPQEIQDQERYIIRVLFILRTNS